MAQASVGRHALMIGLDAADPTLVEAGMTEGWLPNLRRLRDRGAYGRLTSSAAVMSGSPWPTFYTGTGPHEHGLYKWHEWRPEKMWLCRCDPGWRPVQPFWRRWGSDKPRVVAFDVPMAFPPVPFNGVEVGGWAIHDGFAKPASHPPGLIRRIQREFGKAPMGREVFTRQPYADVLAIRDRMISATERAGTAARGLMHREAWDFAIIVFTATHRAGHKLWNETGLVETDCPPAAESLPRALRDVYIASDTALGRIFEEAGAATTVLAFSLHGMGPNESRLDVLDEMLRRALAWPERPPTHHTHVDLPERLRQAVPLSWRRVVKRNLPQATQDWLTQFWRRRAVDWSATEAVTTDPDLQGYIRINLKGRERLGIVEPGAEFDHVCARIGEGLQSFVDADTGEPVVEDVLRVDRQYPSGAAHHALPDLLVRWAHSPAAHHRALHSEMLGTIPWPCPGRHPTGRAGNHRGEGWLIAHGPGVTPGGTIRGADILDLAPTVHDLLGVEIPAHMQGRSLLPW